MAKALSVALAVTARASDSFTAEHLKISGLSCANHELLREGKMDVFGYLETGKYRGGLRIASTWYGSFKSIEKEWLQKTIPNPVHVN